MEEKINLKEITLEEAMEQLNYYGASCFLTESFTNRTPFLKMRANWEKNIYMAKHNFWLAVVGAIRNGINLEEISDRCEGSYSNLEGRKWLFSKRDEVYNIQKATSLLIHQYIDMGKETIENVKTKPIQIMD